MAGTRTDKAVALLSESPASRKAKAADAATAADWRAGAQASSIEGLMDDRRARNHARDRGLVLATMPSSASWEPAVTTEEIVKAVRLPRRRVLTLLHELNVDGFAVEAGGRWRLRPGIAPPAS